MARYEAAEEPPTAGEWEAKKEALQSRQEAEQETLVISCRQPCFYGNTNSYIFHKKSKALCALKNFAKRLL